MGMRNFGHNIGFLVRGSSDVLVFDIQLVNLAVDRAAGSRAHKKHLHLSSVETLQGADGLVACMHHHIRFLQ
jgi:hypothetical protein